MSVYNKVLYSAFWPNTALRTTRLSATNPRTFATLIASTDGGAGSASRVFKWFKKYNQNKGPIDYFITELGGDASQIGLIGNFSRQYRPYRMEYN